jgi:hypothetical protein
MFRTDSGISGSISPAINSAGALGNQISTYKSKSQDDSEMLCGAIRSASASEAPASRNNAKLKIPKLKLNGFIFILSKPQRLQLTKSNSLPEKLRFEPHLTIESSQ